MSDEQVTGSNFEALRRQIEGEIIVERFATRLREALETSPEPHVCPDGCHCRQAYRRAIAEHLRGTEG